MPMPLDLETFAELSQGQAQQCAAFAERVSRKIRLSETCQFALLPQDELVRLVSGWYAASASGMVRNNSTEIDVWTQKQAKAAAAQRFELDDLLEFLRICREAAVQDEKWSEDIFSVVDDAINTALQSIGTSVPWNVPPFFNYLTGKGSQPPVAPIQPVAPTTFADAPNLDAAESASDPWLEDWSKDRRNCGRNQLKLPIRIRTAKATSIDELTYSENISRSGLYFLTRNSSYKLQLAIKVTYPYWAEPGAINREYDAKVVRMDRMTDGSFGVAVEFTEALGPRGRH
jgi:hypothetical protein